jgi:hypothetical protein
MSLWLAEFSHCQQLPIATRQAYDRISGMAGFPGVPVLFFLIGQVRPQATDYDI